MLVGPTLDLYPALEYHVQMFRDVSLVNTHAHRLSPCASWFLTMLRRPSFICCMGTRSNSPNTASTRANARQGRKNSVGQERSANYNTMQGLPGQLRVRIVCGNVKTGWVFNSQPSGFYIRRGGEVRVAVGTVRTRRNHMCNIGVSRAPAGRVVRASLSCKCNQFRSRGSAAYRQRGVATSTEQRRAHHTLRTRKQETPEALIAAASVLCSLYP